MERKIEFAPGKELRIEGSAEWHPPVELSSSSSRISDLAAAAAAQPHEWACTHTRFRPNIFPLPRKRKRAFEIFGGDPIDNDLVRRNLPAPTP